MVMERLLMAAAGLVAVAAAGCKGSAQWSGFGSHSSDGQGSSPSAVNMPDLTLMTQAEAEETLRRAGFTGGISLDAFACGSTLDDKRVVELGRVCHQAPAPGRPASTAIAVSLRVQQENPWRGEYRPGRGWFLMPDLTGIQIEQAKSKLRELGFTKKEALISYVIEPECRPSAVCRTSPAAWERADTTSDKILFVGQPPEKVTDEASSSPAATAVRADPSATKPLPPKEPPASTKPADIF